MMTLKQAKEHAKKHGERLPRCGYEYIIIEEHDYRLSLVNNSGKYELREWFKFEPYANSRLMDGHK